jgi:hypothetical protein
MRRLWEYQVATMTIPLSFAKRMGLHMKHTHLSAAMTSAVRDS